MRLRQIETTGNMHALHGLDITPFQELNVLSRNTPGGPLLKRRKEERTTIYRFTDDMNNGYRTKKDKWSSGDILGDEMELYAGDEQTSTRIGKPSSGNLMRMVRSSTGM